MQNVQMAASRSTHACVCALHAALARSLSIAEVLAKCISAVTQDEEEECRRELALQGKEACSHAEGGDGDAEAEADFEFEDRRWRRIRLEPHGGDWHQRCRDVAQEIASSADRTGLVLLQDTG